MKEPVPSVTSINSLIPQSIENIVLKATAKNPKNRYESVREMKKDLQEALTEEHQNDKRIAYRYEEHELEETKIMPKIVKTELKKDTSDKSEKVLNIAIIAMLTICISLVLGIGLFFIYNIYKKGDPDIIVPDVAGMTIKEATTTLNQSGFEVDSKYKEENSSLVEEGKVIKTSPIAGSETKKGREISLTVSLGSNALVLEDYINKSYYEVKALLEAKGIYVLTEKKEVEDSTVKENIIIGQSPKKGTKLVEGDTVTLYVPDIITEYPDMVAEGWTLKDVEAFCKEYKITLLSPEYYETDLYSEGVVIYQSRSPKTRVLANTTLKIKISVLPTLETGFSE